MSVRFCPVEYSKRSKNGKLDGFYSPQIVSEGVYPFLKLRKEASNRLKMPEIEVSRVLRVVEEILQERLKDGFVVELDVLGNIHLTLEGKQEEKECDVNEDSIVKTHVHFKASEALKRDFKMIAFSLKE